MKKILLALFSVALLTACGGTSSLLSGGTKMDTTEATTKVIESLKKNIDFNEWKIYNLYWMEGEELENDLTILSVEMINKSNDCFSQTFLLGGTAAGNVGDLSKARGFGKDELTFDGVKGITLDMINPEAIQKQYEAAKAMIPEEYDFQSISRYDFNEVIPSGNSYLDSKKNIGQINSSFDVNTTERGKEYVESAGKKSMQYYETNFNVLPDGSIEIDE